MSTFYVIIKQGRKSSKEIEGSYDLEYLRNKLSKLNESARGKYYLTQSTPSTAKAKQFVITELDRPKYVPSYADDHRNASIPVRQ